MARQLLAASAGLEAGLCSEVGPQKVILSKGPSQKTRPTEARQRYTVYKWVRNTPTPGVSEWWCRRMVTPQLCPVFCKCWLLVSRDTRISQNARHLLKAFLRCLFTRNQTKRMDISSWHFSVTHSGRIPRNSNTFIHFVPPSSPPDTV